MPDKQMSSRGWAIALIFVMAIAILGIGALMISFEEEVVFKETISKTVTVNFQLYMTIKKIDKNKFKVTSRITRPSVASWFTELDIENIIERKIRERFKELYPDREIMEIKRKAGGINSRYLVFLAGVEPVEQ